QGLLVSPGDTGARQDVVELVHQQRALQVTVVRVTGSFLIFHSVVHGEIFQIVQGNFRQAVVALDIVLVGQGTSVQLQVQLAVVSVWILDVFLQFLHEAADSGMFYLRASFQV